MSIIPSPTPREVYEPRFWKGRIWVQGGPFQGVGFITRCPYGVAMNLSEILTRACARRQITRYTFGPMPVAELKRLPKTTKNAPELRYEPMLSKLASEWQIDWSA